MLSWNDETFVNRAVSRHVGMVRKGKLVIHWVYERGKFVVQFFVGGLLRQSLVALGSEFVRIFRMAKGWIIPDWSEMERIGG